MKKKLVLILAISSLLIACASDPIVTDRDILAAENSHTLNALYERLQADKKLAKSSSEWAQSIRLNLDKVGKKIALKQEHDILIILHLFSLLKSILCDIGFFEFCIPKTFIKVLNNIRQYILKLKCSAL